MTLECASSGRRRAVLAGFAALAGWLTAGHAAARMAAVRPRTATPSMKSVDDEYRRLLALWQEERQRFAVSSNTHDYWKGPYGKAIVALGPAIIPHLIAELRKGDFFFNAPLALITKVDIANGESTSEQANAALWLKWWDAAAPRP